jgi:hypothetical protein
MLMKIDKISCGFRPPPPAGEPSNPDPKKSDVVDADFEVVDDDKKKG